MLKIKNLRLGNVNKVIIGNVNMNSLTSKLDKLKAIIPKYLDFPVITETKFDDTFPNAQFLVLGYFKLFCYHRNRKGGGPGGHWPPPMF